MDGRIKRLKKGRMKLIIGTCNKGRQSFFSEFFGQQSNFDLLQCCFWYHWEKIKYTSYSHCQNPSKCNETNNFFTAILHGWYKSKVSPTMTEAWVANSECVRAQLYHVRNTSFTRFLRRQSLKAKIYMGKRNQLQNVPESNTK